jgi:hypothetical protein
MIDFDEQPLVKRAVARLQTPSKVGTGYLVAVDRIATCHHVVSDLAKGAAVACRFGELGEERTAYVLDLDKPSDSALLELREPISAQPLELSEAVPAEFWMYGFPHFTEGTAVSVDGKLVDRDTLDQNGTRTFAIFSLSFAARTTETIGGFSGSPVLAGRRVIGHMSSVLGSVEARRAPHLGYAFAVRSSGVARLLGNPAPAAAPPLVAGAFDRTISRTQVFQEIEASSTATEVHAALDGGKPNADETLVFAADRLIGLGALDAALDVLKSAASSQRRGELEALALSLRGDHAPAIARLKSLPASSETTAVLGGAFKRRWRKTGAATWLRAAHDAYNAAFEIEHAPYPGVNLAACKLWLGEKVESKRIAIGIAQKLAAKQPREPWERASLAEAFLLSGSIDEARTEYRAAVQAQMTQPRSIAAMRRQVRLELPALGLADDAFDDLFPVPRVAVFTGHRVDDDETRGRFPPSRVAAVRRRIAATLAEREISSGYASAASGGDILFIEELIARGGEPHVFLPFPAAKFIETSVGELWRDRFERILERVGPRLVVLNDHVPDDTVTAYRRCNDAMRLAAVQEGELRDESPVLIAVLTPTAEATTGGSADMVAAWQQAGLGDPIRIDPME